MSRDHDIRTKYDKGTTPARYATRRVERKSEERAMAAEAEARAAESATLADEPRHTLGMPRGSVRALLALCIAASTYWLIANPELQARFNNTIPEQLLGALMLVLGYYFADRAGGQRADGVPAARIGPAPLWLPSGSVRFLIVVGLIAAIVGLATKTADTETFFGLPIIGALIQIIAFLLGRLGRLLLARVRADGRNKTATIIADVKGLIALAAGAGCVVLFCFPDVPIPDDVRLKFDEIFPSLVSFYFGTR
jgi:hypothetical protein